MIIVDMAEKSENISRPDIKEEFEPNFILGTIGWSWSFYFKWDIRDDTTVEHIGNIMGASGTEFPPF